MADRDGADAGSERTLLDKLGIKASHRVMVLGVRDQGFLDSLRARGARVSTRRSKNADAIFLACERPADLARIATVKADLRRDGALWTVRPKGKRATGPGEAETMRAGLDAGLVDVKVVSFSDTHSALKFVYRLKDR